MRQHRRFSKEILVLADEARLVPHNRPRRRRLTDVDDIDQDALSVPYHPLHTAAPPTLMVSHTTIHVCGTTDVDGGNRYV